MKSLVSLCITRPVFAAMIVLTLVVVGTASYFRLGVDRFPRIDLPQASVRTALPGAAVEYFVHPTHYDTTETDRLLAGSGVACPPVADYLPTLVKFMKAHRDANVGALV